MKRILIVLTTLAMSSTAFASTLFGLSLLKYQTETEGTTIGASKGDVMNYDAKLGYASQGLYLGGIYSGRSQEDDNRTAYGVTVGYHDGGFYIDGNYFISASVKLASSTLQKGTGFGADIGYNWMVSDMFYMGLELSYKSFTYTEVDNSGTLTDEDNKEKSEMYPMINVGFAF